MKLQQNMEVSLYFSFSGEGDQRNNATEGLLYYNKHINKDTFEKKFRQNFDGNNFSNSFKFF